MNKKISDIKHVMKMSCELDTPLVIFSVSLSLVRAVKPYIAVLLSGYILNCFVLHTAYKQIMLVTFFGVLLTFIFSVLEGKMDKYWHVHVDTCVRKFEMEKCKKTLTMDYEMVESPVVDAMRNRIRNDNIWGAGFSTVFSQLSEFGEYFFQFLIGLIILLSMLFSPSFLGDWITIIYFIVLITVTILLSLFQVRYINKRKEILMDGCVNEASYLDYFMLRQIDYKIGKDIRIYNGKKIIKDSLSVGWNRWQHFWTNSFNKINALDGAIAGLSTGFLQGGAYVLVIMKAVDGTLSVGKVVVYALAIFNFSKNLTTMFECLSRFTLTARRQVSKLEYLEMPNKTDLGTCKIKINNNDKYEFEFKNVSFKYTGNENYALKDINLKLNAGQCTAVVGMNGSGKTTLVKLLCRMYEPTEGEIMLNGKNIKEYEYESYMRVFSVVFQDFMLFSFKLGQNIAASSEYDYGKALEAINKSGFAKRFSNMPKGLETNLYKNLEEDGMEISGGEAQKIALARALYKDAPFVILDEPTAALDPISEYEVFSGFNKIIGNKSGIYISHRLSSCRFSDEIVVLNEGKLVQQGNHDTLLQDKQGKYYELWNAQAKYYEKNFDICV